MRKILLLLCISMLWVGNGFAWDISANVVAQYKMNDDAATTVVLDATGSYNGTLDGGDNTEDITTTGVIGSALALNGTDDHIDLGSTVFNDALSGDFAIVGWFDWASTTVTRYVFNKRKNASDYRGIIGVVVATNHATIPGKFAVTYSDIGEDDKVDLVSDDAVNGDGWHMFVVQRSGTTLELYVDGSSNDSDTCNTDDISNTNPFYIGCSRSESNHFNGSVDNFILLDRALTQAEITALYNSGSGTEALSGGASSSFIQSIVWDD